MGAMEGSRWFVENWFELLSAVGIIGSLLFTATALRSDTKTRRIAHLLTVTTNHREIWKELYRHPQLARILKPSIDLARQPITAEEEQFVKFVILHLSSMYYAMRDELVIKLEGARRDAGLFFSLPIPQAIWEKIKVFQNDDFVAFVEECRREAPSL